MDRKTVKKYVAVAKAAGFKPGEGEGPPEGWPAWVDKVLPGIRERGRLHPTVRELHERRQEIAKLLAEVSPTVGWRRLSREKGLQVSLTSFRRYVQRYLPELLKSTQVTVRLVDSSPGEEAQVDYGFLGMWMDPLTGKRRAVHVFTIVLSHSRHLFARVVFRMDQQAWLECHVAALVFFGGAPRRVVPDNLKTGVLKADLYDPKFNR
ncbi:MAG: DDE-type integrase/transposase/recombinase, partial [Chloroflexota bacterium]